jgi:hypothetical protein
MRFISYKTIKASYVGFLSLMLFNGMSVRAFASSESSFTCQCVALGPGADSPDGTKKLCSYHCACGTQELDLRNLESSAYSWEDWDRGSHICHGQYAWRPRLDAPNWQIVVKFSPFKISEAGKPIYDSTAVEIAPGILMDLPRSEDALEIRDAIRAKLNVL